MRLVPALAIACAVAGCSTDHGAARDDFLRRGDQQYASQQFRAASIEYKNAIKQDPASAVAQRKLADSYIALRQPDKALESYLRALAIDRQDLTSQLRAGSLFLLGGDFDRAASHARDAIELDSKNIDARVLLANALAGVRDVRGAVAELEHGVTLNPGEWRGHSALGDLHWINGDTRAAEASFQKALELDPNSAPARVAIAQFYWGTGRIRDAESQLQRALEIEPANRDANGLMAEFYMMTGRAGRAEPYWRALAEDPADPAGKFALADYYAMTGRTDEALAIVKPLAAAKDKDHRAGARLAAVLYDSGDRAGATELVERILREDPDQPMALLIRSRMALDQKKWADARDAAQEVALGPNGSWVAHYMLGMAQMGLREFAAASRSFNDALRLNPQAVVAHIKRAEALAAGGDAWSAIQSLEQAFPDQPQAVGIAANNLAWALGSSDGDLRAAQTLAQLATERLKARPEPLDTLGMIYLKQGEHARAAELFRASLRLAPDNATYRSHLEAARE